MLKSNLCDYSHVHILVKRNITVKNTAGNNTNKKSKT